MKTYHDIVGDGGSNVVGQVEALQSAIQSSLAGVRYKVAVGSGKGGVGKSTITTALARALRHAGQSVAILDGDFNGPCQAQLLGLGVAPWVPGADGRLKLPRSVEGIGVASFGSLLPDARPVEFDSVAQGEEQTWRGTREFALLSQLLASVEWGAIDVLLFDLPPGAERTRQFAHALGSNTAFVLVTIPSDLSRGVVSRSITALESSATEVLGYVENMAGYYCRDCQAIRPLFPAPTIELSIPCLGKIPFDPSVAAIEASTEAQQDGHAIQAIRAIAENILHTLESKP